MEKEQNVKERKITAHVVVNRNREIPYTKVINQK